MKLRLSANRLAILLECRHHLAVVLRFQLLSSTHVRRTIIATLIALFDDTILLCIIRTQLLLKGILGGVDDGDIFEELPTIFLLMVNIYTCLLDCAVRTTRETIKTIYINCISCFVDHFKGLWLLGIVSR